jgi:hypothetical protein
MGFLAQFFARQTFLNFLSFSALFQTLLKIDGRDFFHKRQGAAWMGLSPNVVYSAHDR